MQNGEWRMGNATQWGMGSCKWGSVNGEWRRANTGSVHSPFDTRHSLFGIRHYLFRRAVLRDDTMMAVSSFASCLKRNSSCCTPRFGFRFPSEGIARSKSSQYVHSSASSSTVATLEMKSVLHARSFSIRHSPFSIRHSPFGIRYSEEGSRLPEMPSSRIRFRSVFRLIPSSSAALS